MVSGTPLNATLNEKGGLGLPSHIWGCPEPVSRARSKTHVLAYFLNPKP